MSTPGAMRLRTATATAPAERRSAYDRVNVHNTYCSVSGQGGETETVNWSNMQVPSAGHQQHQFYEALCSIC